MAAREIGARDPETANDVRFPLLAAIDEQLPWVRQWHNEVDPELDVRPGDYFTSWLGEQLDRHGWSGRTLVDWQPEPGPRRRRRA